MYMYVHMHSAEGRAAGAPGEDPGLPGGDRAGHGRFPKSHSVFLLGAETLAH